MQVASLELSGQLVGDISETLKGLDARLGKASIVNVSCTRLIRVDFIAAGDLLNWVLNRRGENRHIVFEDTHRLVALFFGAMGITEHARVKVLAMPESEYMNDKQLEFFRHKLLSLKEDLLSNAGETTEHLREDTSINVRSLSSGARCSLSRSLASKMPMMFSRSPSNTGKRECAVSITMRSSSS